MKNFGMGAALLAAVADAVVYRSGEVRSREQFKYGRFSVRMKGSGKPGSVSTFFTYWDSPNWSKSEWNEIDIEVAPSQTKNPMSTNIFLPGGSQDQRYCMGIDPGTDWNDYVIEWTPGRIEWFFNGKSCRISQSRSASLQEKPMTVMMNFWTATFKGWSEGFSDADMPWYTLYDYVKVEKYNTASGEFVPYFEDNFDTFDSSRWRLSEDWGFGGNSSRFYSSQVFIENGALVIKLEKPVNQSNDESPWLHWLQ